MKDEIANDYCLKCYARMDSKLENRITNQGTQCILEYKQNPQTERATQNVRLNAGFNSVCPKNPWR